MKLNYLIRTSWAKTKVDIKKCRGGAVKTLARHVHTFSQPIIIIGMLSSAVAAVGAAPSLLLAGPSQ